MYRTIENEKVALATRKTGFAAIGVFAERAVNSVRRAFEKAAIARELSALDDRELSDIGLGRGDIAAVAEASVATTGEPGFGAAVVELLHDALVAPVVLWNKRRAAFGALNSLDDRMLSDIGVARAEIGSVVKGIHKSVSYPAVTLDVVAPIAAWNRARQTANQLYRLEDRMLADIGVVRGDIEWLASEVANKAVAANRNAATGPAPRAA
jgi:uncharacterized protein YjiS (DUF1127 family)